MSGWGAIYNNTMTGLRRQSLTLSRLQEQVSTGARVIRASDDPSDANRIMHLRIQSANIDDYVDNINDVTLSMNHGYNLLSEIQSGLSSVKTLLTQAASTTYSAENRTMMSASVDSMLEQAVSHANGGILGRHIFAGSSPSVEPYTVTRENGKIVSVQYVGGDRTMPVPVGPGITYSGQLVGNDVFQSDNRQAPEFLGSTGVSGGTGTSNITGDVWLSLAHTLTKHDDGANPAIAAGTSSATGDTILGTHTLTVDTNGTSGTIALDGGPVVTFTGAETDLAVISPSGNVVYLDVSGIAGAYTGDLTIKGEGQMSVDAGESWTNFVEADFADGNFAVTNQAGKFLYVDGASVGQTGQEPIRIQGTYDLFSMLINIRDALSNERGMAETEQLAFLRRSNDAIAEVSVGIMEHQTATGSRLEAIDRLTNSLLQLQANMDDEAGNLESADLVTLALELAKTDTLYQLTLQTAAKLLNRTLMDYL